MAHLYIFFSGLCLAGSLMTFLENHIFESLVAHNTVECLDNSAKQRRSQKPDEEKQPLSIIHPSPRFFDGGVLCHCVVIKQTVSLHR